jgi:hypothetical protein
MFDPSQSETASPNEVTDRMNAISISGGINLDAREDIVIEGDVVGRDKVTQMQGDNISRDKVEIHAEPGATVIVGLPLPRSALSIIFAAIFIVVVIILMYVVNSLTPSSSLSSGGPNISLVTRTNANKSGASSQVFVTPNDAYSKPAVQSPDTVLTPTRDLGSILSSSPTFVPATPVPSNTPTPTPTPEIFSTISSSNAERITQLALWEDDSATRVIWALNDKMLLIGSHFTYLHILDGATLEGSQPIDVPRSTDGMILSPDGTSLALVDSFSGVALWDVINQSEIGNLVGSKGTRTAAFSPDGTLLATGTDMTVKLWDVVDRKEIRTLVVKDGIRTLAFTPDGKHIAVGGDLIRLLDVSNGQETRSFIGSENVNCIDFTPDGQELVAGSFYGWIKSWNIASGSLVHSLIGHPSIGNTAWIRGIALSPDGKLVASVAAGEPTFKLWNLADGRELQTFVGHSQEVESVAFSADGTKIASGGGDGVRLWGVK